MKYSLISFALLTATSLTHADGPSLKDARERLLHGNYAEAQEQYTQLAKDAKTMAAATIGLSKTLQSQGEYDKALSVVETALKELPKYADLLARQAEVLHLRGRWEDAQKAAEAAIKLNDNQFLARWVLGQTLRDRGELKKADDVFRWFVVTYTKRSNMDMDISDPDELLYVGLAACERARRIPEISDQFDFVLNEVWTDAVKKDKDFWPAEYESARLLTEKSNKAGAYRCFEKALAINPRAAEVLVGKGMAAFAHLEIKDADHLVQRAIKINPNLPEARRLLSDIHMFTGNVKEAQKELALARKINPRDEATLARIAACLHLEKKDKELADLIKDVESHNAKLAVFYYELAAQLDVRKAYDQAEECYRQAIKLQPQLPYAQNGLGLMYMRRGKEVVAKETLEKAFIADPFNIRVGNTLKVLDHLAKYKTLETEHFHLRYDPANDAVLANFMAKYLEDIYAELAKKFQYRPKGPILIEVFNKHEMFSGRVMALPDLHTIGACTGDMVAMVSPRDKSGVIGKPFNWNRVIRHELVHIFNLEQTKYKVPHWFTEGLAVMLEGGKPPGMWNHLLAEKVQSNELLNLDTVLLGFIRPRSPDEWQQAYLQSLLYVEYLVLKHGDQAIGAMLDAYRDGLDTGPAIEKVCKISKAEFEKGYRAFLDERVKKLGATVRSMSLKELKEAHAKDPKDADIAARLADRLFTLGDKGDAGKLADEVLAGKKDHGLAAYVKARVLAAAGEKDKALALLDSVAKADPPSVKAIALQAKLHFERKNFKQAAEALERGRKIEPHEPAWLKQLAAVYTLSSEAEKLIDVLKDLVPTEADDLVIRRKLAQLLEKANRHAEAEHYSRMALEIDVLDAESVRILEGALTAQNKDENLKQLRKLLNK